MPDPTSHLVAPSVPDETWTQGFVNPVDLFNYASPAAWTNKGVEAVTGFDVFGYFTDAITGEWDAIWKFGEAVGNLAACLDQLGINVRDGVIQLDEHWDGNAADAAHQYFLDFAAALNGQQIDLKEIEQGYQKAALGAWQLSNQLSNILQAIADKFVIGAIAAAAGAATGVGAGAGYGVAALQAVEILAMVNKASILINTVGSTVMGIFGTGMTVGYRGGSLTTIPLPAGAYAKPGA
ncbi:hypothetical protein [Actinoplanes sp. DH11]|uniref:hypothetical protein n=1 Tax=Actinoplanes sp. DH11 TaxID=2857011 RepID=UPI001E452FF3|nr:hypothetical protein [Actinoplanes sp. DH11]